MSRYREIADHLRSEIEQGTYERGAALPSETELATQHSVSRPVVNRALQVLRAEGLVRVERGKGSVVHEIEPLVRRAVIRHSKSAREKGGAFGAEITRLGHVPSTDLVQVGPVTPPARVAELLDLGRDGVAAIRNREMFADDTPVQLAASYIPWALAAETPITQRDVGPRGTYGCLADQGYAVIRWRERITSRPPSSHEAKFFRLSSDQRVHEIERVAYTADGTAVEVTVMSLPAHQWVLEYEWSDSS